MENLWRGKIENCIWRLYRRLSFGRAQRNTFDDSIFVLFLSYHFLYFTFILDFGAIWSRTHEIGCEYIPIFFVCFLIHIFLSKSHGGGDERYGLEAIFQKEVEILSWNYPAMKLSGFLLSLIIFSSLLCSAPSCVLSLFEISVSFFLMLEFL